MAGEVPGGSARAGRRGSRQVSRRSRPGRGVALLVGALAALAAAILLVSRPDVVTDAVEDVVGWVVQRVDDTG